MNVIPAIIGENFEEVKEKINIVKELTEWVQVDVVDGIFADGETWGTRIGQTHDLWEPIHLPKIEMHLMVKKPEVCIRDWISASVDRILIHHESDGDKNKMFKLTRESGIKTGIVLNLETPIDVIGEYIKNIDTIQLMSIKTIGHYGEAFDEIILGKTKDLRNKYPDVTIQIDGGVNLDSAKKAKEAGVTSIVVGSAIYKSGDVEGIIKKFQKL